MAFVKASHPVNEMKERLKLKNNTSEQSDSGGDSPSRCGLTQSPPEGLKITASHRKLDFFTGRLGMAFVKASHPVNEKNKTSTQSDSGGEHALALLLDSVIPLKDCLKNPIFRVH